MVTFSTIKYLIHVYVSGGSDMPDGDRMQVSQQKVLTTTRPLVDGDSEDEKLTLEEFLQECNQTPMARVCRSYATIGLWHHHWVMAPLVGYSATIGLWHHH